MATLVSGPARRLCGARASWVAALALLTLLAATARAQPVLVFDGVVEAARRAELATDVSGVVRAIHFAGGERVAAGQTLIEIDDAAFLLAVEDAKATLDHAKAEATAAGEEAARSAELSARGVAPDTRLRADRTRLAQAQALRMQAGIALRRAELDLARTRIAAPLAGVVGRPDVALGAFVEAKAGPPLALIMQLDPALVAYRVPYADRLA
ncbi:MAG: efflux RND transporter periplasmic adaptor subunit, partial [Paracoccaceae bacterium]